MEKTTSCTRIQVAPRSGITMKDNIAACSSRLLLLLFAIHRWAICPYTLQVSPMKRSIWNLATKSKCWNTRKRSGRTQITIWQRRTMPIPLTLSGSFSLCFSAWYFSSSFFGRFIIAFGVAFAAACSFWTLAKINLGNGTSRRVFTSRIPDRTLNVIT